MAVKLDRAKVAELSKEIKEMAHLGYKPIGIKLVKSEDEIPNEARRPSARGQTWPVCLAGNIVRTIGWTIALTLEDHFCVIAAAGLGHIELPDYLKDGSVGAHHCKNREIGTKIQETLESCFFEPGSTVGVVLTPAEAPLVDPEGIYFYGNPSQIGKISKGIAWYRGENVPAVAGGLAACVVGACAALKDRKPRIVMPCSGEKILGHTEENDVFIAIPVEELPDVVEGMKATDYILPYPTAKYMSIQVRVPKDYPVDMATYKAWKEGKKEGSS